MGRECLAESHACEPEELDRRADQDVIRTGVRPDGSRLKPPMGVFYYANIPEKDLDAIVAYLRTLPEK